MLTRFVDEEVWIDVPAGCARRIVVKVGRAERGSVRLGFEADDDVGINRRDVALSKERDAARGGDQ